MTEYLMSMIDTDSADIDPAGISCNLITPSFEAQEKDGARKVKERPPIVSVKE
jgi:hypothetical protein